MSRFDSLATKYDALTIRERGIIFFATLFGLFMLLSMPVESLWKEYRQASQTLSQTRATNHISEQQLALYQERLAQDPNRDFLQRKALLEKEHQQLDKALEEQTLDMVPARLMPSVLAKMLDGAKGLTLTGFESIAPVPLIEVGEGEQKLNLYSHGMALTLEGDFFAVQRFVEAVEGLENKLYWKRMDYRVKAYPKAEVQLMLHTLSVNEDFIRVANQ
ncbi:MSHA biogenesis protein MshJ [Shewanella zhangzhouensis]|uniref:MSHA biogenesis protein MshJ n=1 Tax=Shewanella zhangzhouensis TaxID=2864213 RepID=UPI001C65971A|nr:MSHA biogenesis protein MshJ [Shewanella zhangzhouensis]QYK05718.1 MSHA biogenesis protein MshJ [Shewanella zhangzhouensis]